MDKSERLSGFMMIGGLAIALLLIITGCNRAMTFDDVYPPPWRTDPNRDITDALADQAIQCPQYRWRQSFNFDNNGEVLVHCGINSSQWRAYLVLIPTYKVIGPFPPDAMAPLSLQDVQSAHPDR